MHELIGSFLSNDSPFGKAMTHAGVVIGANVMFVIFSLPVITAGAAYAALEFTIFRMERGDGVINPFKEFWKGFKANFKQGTITAVIAGLLAAFLLMDLRIVSRADGFIAAFKYPVMALLIIEVTLLIWLFPAMASFEDTLPNLIRNCVYFAFHRIWKLPVLLFFHLFSFYLSYTDVQMQPLYAFIWAFFGFGLLAVLDAKLILPEFVPYLPVVDEYGDFILEGPEGVDEEEEGEEEPYVRMSVAEVRQRAAMARQEEERKGSGSDRAGQDRGGHDGGAAPHKSEQEILEEMKKLGM